MSKTILQFTKRLLGVLGRCSFFSPKRAPVMVIDKNRSHDMTTLLGDINHVFIEVRGEKIYFSVGILLALLKINIKEAKNDGAGTIRALMYALSGGNGRYLDACIHYVRPKVVITLIDNNVNFFNLSSRFSDIAFVAIQAAWRIKRRIDAPAPGNHNHAYYFCLSEHDKEMFSSIGYDKDRLIVTGSLRQSLWAKSPNPSPQHFDICVTSQWRSELFVGEDSLYPTFGNVITSVYQNIAKLIAETGLSCCIATAKREDDEIAYFRELFGPEVFINDAKSKLGTYDLMAASSLVVTVNSTSGREAAGMGVRVLFCDPPSEESVYEDQTTASSLFLMEADYENLRNKVLELMSLSNEEYDRKYGVAANHLMARQDAIFMADQIKEFVQQKISD